jgi:hypothetical protein
MKTIYDKYDILGVPEPVIYVDSINKDGHMAEIYNQTMRYIRENTSSVHGKEIYVRREDHIVKDEKSIGNKLNGFWFVSNEKDRTLTLYKKSTIPGYFSYYPEIKKVYVMYCRECPKVVPNLIKKGNVFEDFAKELKSRVAEIGRRTDSLELNESDIC